MLRKLEEAMQNWRLRERLTPEEYRLARLVDAELIAALEKLDRRLQEVEHVRR